MELAADQDKAYKFTTTFFGTSGGGYIIEAVGDMSRNDKCVWNTWIQYHDPLQEIKLEQGVSSFLPSLNINISLRYEEVSKPDTIEVGYAIVFPPSLCNTSTYFCNVTVPVPVNATYVTVMEAAVDQFGPQYQFILEYYGTAMYTGLTPLETTQGLLKVPGFLT